INRTTPDPSPDGSKRSSSPYEFPSWEGLGVGSWSQRTTSKSWRRSMNRTNSKSTRPSKAAEHRRTPKRWRVGYGGPNIRQVLQCAADAALGLPTSFRVTMHVEKAKRGFPRIGARNLFRFNA